MPLVSVVIAAYNAENTITQTINSVLDQTFKDLEIIVIDDGSKDKTSDRVLEIKDSRVKLFPYENGGVAKARNRGISHASGEYIAFLDHDDLWTPDKIETQLRALQKSPDAGVAYSWTINMYSEEKPIRFTKLSPVNFEGDVYPQLLLYNFVASGSNILARAAAVKSVGGFDPTPVSNEDWDFYLRLAAKWSFVLVPKYQIIYRHTANSMSSQVQRLEKGGLILTDKAYQSAPANLQHLKQETLCNHYLYCSILYIESYSHSQAADCRKNLTEAYRTLRLASRYCPQVLIKKAGFAQMLKLLSASILTPKLIRQLKKAKQQYLDRPTRNPIGV